MSVLFYSNQFIEYRSRLPRFSRWIMLVAALTILTILFRESLFLSSSFRLFYPIPVLMVFIASILVLRQGYTPAKLYVFAISFVIISIVFLFLNKINAFNIALIFEVIIFSFGQGKKLLFYQQEQQEILEQRLLEIKQKNETLEKYIASNSELQQFAYVASHDMKQPLRTIIGFSQLLERRLKHDGELNPEIKEYLEFIISSSFNLESLTSDLLDHAKVSQMGDFDFQRTAMQDILDKVTLNLSQQIQESGVDIHASALPTICIEPNRMAQLLQNLISNAIKFLKQEGQGKIDISAREDETYWEFQITDNGIGIPADKQAKVFDIFTKLHRRDQYPGHGIGLATCKKIVAIHQGKMWLESEEGVGTSFFFTIKKDLQSQHHELTAS